MNFKACCGLLAGGKDSEDYDYDDVEDPLPEPQTRAYVQRKHGQRSTHTANVYTAAGYSAKAASRAELSAETPDKPVRRGTDALATARTPAALQREGQGQHRQPQQQQQQQQQEHHGVPTMEPLTRGGAGGGSSARAQGSESSKAGNTVRPKRRAPRQATSSASSSSSSSSSSVPSSGAQRRGAPEGQNQHQQRQARDQGDARGVYGAAGGGVGTVEALRPAAKGAVGLGVGLGAGSAPASRVGAGAGSGAASRLPSGRATRASTMVASGAAAAARGGGGGPGTFDLARFEEKLGGGLIVTKINRQGRAKVRTLFYDSKEKMLWWNEPGGRQNRQNRQRGTSSKSSLLSMSLRKEQPLPVASLVKVEMAEKLDEPFCFDADVDKSFQLVFPARTVDLVAKDAEEAALLARGFQELKLSVSA